MQQSNKIALDSDVSEGYETEMNDGKKLCTRAWQN